MQDCLNNDKALAVIMNLPSDFQRLPEVLHILARKILDFVHSFPQYLVRPKTRLQHQVHTQDPSPLQWGLLRLSTIEILSEYRKNKSTIISNPGKYKIKFFNPSTAAS